jgi:membrane protein CcdC involved in cytochrome C biogenesis
VVAVRSGQSELKNASISSKTYTNMTNYGLVAGMCFGMAFGVIYAWATHVVVEQRHAKEIEEIVGDLNAYRVMAEWD